MNTYLTAQNVSLSYSTTSLFKNLNFTINSSDKIGLIGHNGCGKSSLLKLLVQQMETSEGTIAKAKLCLLSYIEQHLPEELLFKTVLQVLALKVDEDETWRAEQLLSELGFAQSDLSMPVHHCSGGQQMRLLLARAIINRPDLLLLDEPSNHLDLPSILWLEQFLKNWKGSFVLVSHDQQLLDRVTNTTWIIRDQKINHFSLPCSAAREALIKKDEQDQARYVSEQREIDRIQRSAKRLASWGKDYDNEDLARKAKTMYARMERLENEQTQLSENSPWVFKLQGERLPANRLLEIKPFTVTPLQSNKTLFEISEKRIKSGDRIAVLGGNGCGKSSLLNLLHHHYQFSYAANQELKVSALSGVTFHDRCRLGYYDQSLSQLSGEDNLPTALVSFAGVNDEQAKQALIRLGFKYTRHNQKVASLSGGERSRLLFLALSLAKYHLVFLDEPSNHLDLEGKEELVSTLNSFDGAAVLVSHDRKLIEQSCNRFWLIKDGVLTEYLSAEEVYKHLSEQSTRVLEQKQISTNVVPNNGSRFEQEEVLLERILELESLLEDDLQRKPKHQKCSLQIAWREEIEKLSAQL